MYNLFIRFPYPPYFLGDVRRAIRSKGEQLTREEENLLMKFEDRVVTVYYAGVCVGTVSLWLVFRRLNPTKVHWQAIWKNLTWEPESLRKDDIAKICRLQEKFKFSLIGGGVSGGLLAEHYFKSSLHRMLSLDGSPIQRELLKPEYDTPWMRKIVSKHLIPKVVYPESSADKKPILRRRF